MQGVSLTSNIFIVRQPLPLFKTYNLLGVILDKKLDFNI